MNAYWHFARYLLRYRSRLFGALACAITAAVLFGLSMTLALPAFRVLFRKEDMDLRTYYTQVNEGEKGWMIPDWAIQYLPEGFTPSVIAVVLTIVVLMVISSILRIVHNYQSAIVCVEAIRDIRVDLMRKLVALPMLSLMEQAVTERVSRVMRDSQQVARAFLTMTGRSLGDILYAIAALSVAVVVEPMIIVAAIAVSPVYAWYYRRHGKLVRKAGKRMLAEWSNMLGVIVESLQGMRVVKVHHAERFEVDRFRDVNREYVRAEFPLRWRKSVASPVIQVISMATFLIVALVVVYRIDRGYTNPGQVLTALLALLFVAQRLKPITMLYSEIAEAAAAGDRLLEIHDLEVEQPEDSGKKDLPRLSKSIEFRGVSFTYPNADRPALTDIDLRIERGKVVAFVGPNGCGKTTLLSLVPRLFDPQTGTIRVDGHDLREVTLSSLRQQMAVVTQETVLFRDSIARNIAYGLDDPRREEIEDAAKHAHAEPFIRLKENGFDTQVGERGLTLSGGERQRVAIARAILRDPAILILDEATSMIDAETEALITQALNEFCKSRTSLVIAHRLSTVVDADEIVVMNEGRIIDRGPHAKLIKRCELYHQLCKTQLVSEQVKGASGNQKRKKAKTKTAPLTEPDDELEELIEDY